MKHRINTLLIIGNGFDVDLGLKTRYNDFADISTGYLPHAGTSNLSKFINTSALNSLWGGLETSLEEYANLPKDKHSLNEDKIYFQSLKISLRLYLDKVLNGKRNQEGEIIPESNDHFNKESCAYHLCEQIAYNPNVIDYIISFNYTDICDYLKDVPVINESINYFKERRSFIHRVESEMVLGISNSALLPDSRYDFLKKYKQAICPGFFDELLAAENIIFYGLSFSKPDQDYFKEFFQLISSRTEIGLKKNLYIVSRDDNSFENILEEISAMLDNNISGFLMRNHIIQVNTDRGVFSLGFDKILHLFN